MFHDIIKLIFYPGQPHDARAEGYRFQDQIRGKKNKKRAETIEDYFATLDFAPL